MNDWKAIPHPFYTGKWAVSRVSDAGWLDHVCDVDEMRIRAFDSKIISRLHADGLNNLGFPEVKV